MKNGVIMLISLVIFSIPYTLILFGEKIDLEQKLKDKQP